MPERTLELEYVGAADLRDALSPARVRAAAAHLATLHDAGLVHGDPTTRNARVAPDQSPAADVGDEAGRTYLVDFGLGYHSTDVEDFAMDLHVLRGSVTGTADDPDPLLDAAREAYAARGDPDVLDRLADIEGRGRYSGD